jgi:hypothetical protein
MTMNRSELVRAVFPLLRELDSCVELLGSGCFFRKNDQTYVVSAAHVLKSLAATPDDVGVPAGPTTGTTQSVWTLGKGRLGLSDEETYDVAVYRLDDPSVVARIEDLGWLVLSASDVDAGPGGGGVHVLFGWPLEQVTVEATTMLSPKGKPVLVETQRIAPPVADLTDSKMPLHSADMFLQWPTGSKLDFYGVSGAPIWVERASGNGVEYPSPRLKLAGVEHRVLDSKYIRGTLWGIVGRAIEQMEAKP